ncbi:hypothetical protein ACFLRN_02865 [Thermoproteota archaeon]
MLDLGIKKRDYNGLSIFELASHPITHATVCSGAEHQKWTGTFTIDRTEGSYRYGDEVQFVVWSLEPPKIKMERAFNDGYFRIEICIPKENAIHLLEDALSRLYNSENRVEAKTVAQFL